MTTDFHQIHIIVLESLLFLYIYFDSQHTRPRRERCSTLSMTVAPTRPESVLTGTDTEYAQRRKQHLALINQLRAIGCVTSLCVFGLCR